MEQTVFMYTFCTFQLLIEMFLLLPTLARAYLKYECDLIKTCSCLWLLETAAFQRPLLSENAFRPDTFQTLSIGVLECEIQALQSYTENYPFNFKGGNVSTCISRALRYKYIEF